jgi:hypothetical protein
METETTEGGEQTDCSEVPGEQTAEQFFVSFRSERQAIEQDMESLTAGSDRVHETLDALLLRVQALEAAFMRSAHLLPKYDLQQYRSILKSLATGIGTRREELAPRKKFSFKRRDPAKSAKATACDDSVVLPRGPTTDSSVQDSAGKCSVVIESSPSELIEGEQAALISRGPGAISGRDVSLKALTSCRVVLLDHVGALHCHGLQRCEIIVGCIESSALLYDCHECIITLAAKQLRLHDSNRISLHLHTLSGPVVENCQQILVSPYNLTYPEVQAHWIAASLGTTTDISGTWAEVQDFNWHKRQASPNWCVLPDNMRPATLEFSDSTALSTDASLPPLLEELQCCDACFGDAKGN